MSTGVANLDAVVGGGLREGSVTLVLGPPGSGKTILGNQFCFRHATSGTRAVYVTQLAETHDRMLEYINELSFARRDAVGSSVAYISGFPAIEGEGLNGLLNMIRSVVHERRARALVLDELMTAELAARSELEFKRFVHQLQAFAAAARCTTLLLTTSSDEVAPGPAVAVVDGVIRLSTHRDGLRTLRTVEVVKLRGTAVVPGSHHYDITNDGLQVYPRATATLGQKEPDNAPIERLSTGVPELDRMFHGGLFRGDSTVLVGGAGSGKTVFALHFLIDGARNGERCVHLGFYEARRALVEAASHVSLDLDRHVASGAVSVMWRGGREHLLDQIAHELINEVRRTGARRVVIDGLNALRERSEHASRVADVIVALTNELRSLGVTTVWTDEAHGPQGAYIKLSVPAVSAIVESVIMLRCVEHTHGLRRSISLRKARGGAFVDGLREVFIRDTGLEISTSAAGIDEWFKGTVLSADAPIAHVAEGDGRQP